MKVLLRWMLGLCVALGGTGCGKLFGGEEQNAPPSTPAPSTPKWAKDNPTRGSTSKPSLRLETTPGSSVSVFAGYGAYLCSTTPAATATADASGVATVQLDVGDSSSTLLYAEARLEGKDSGCSSSFSYTVDTSPPPRPTWNSDVPKVGVARQLTLKGRAQEAHALSVHASADCSGPVLASPTRDGYGDFKLDVSVESDSTSPFTIRAVDDVGNAACSAVHTYVHDTQAPAPPVLTGTDPVSPSRVGSLTLVGKAEPGATVTAYTSQDCVEGGRSATADAQGLFRIANLSPDYNTTTLFYAQARDGAGHRSPCAGPLRFVHDNLAPSLSEFTGYFPVSPANHNTPLLAGASQGGAVKARVFDNYNCIGEPLSTVDVDAVGKFHLRVQVADNSTSYFYVELGDTAGNWSSCRAAPSYVEDSLAPSGPLKVALRSSMGTSRNVTLSGEGLNHHRALLFATPDCQGEPVGDVAIPSYSTTFELGATVAEGSTTSFSVALRDAAGNRSGCVGPLTYLHDATPPSTAGVVVVDGPEEDLAHQRTGSVVEAHWSGFTDANGPLQYRHLVSGHEHCGYPQVTEAPVEGTAVRLAGLSLPEGTYYHCVQASDRVGNRTAYVRSNGFRVDLTPPSVASSVPAGGEAEVDVLAPLVLTFSESMDAASLTADSFTVETGGARVEGTLSCERATCTFKPLRPLPYRESVRVTVSTEARDVAGWPLASAHTLGFTTRGRQWSASPGLVQTARPGLTPDVAVDGQGAAVAVWVQGGADGTFRPYAARRLAHGAWSTPQPLDTLHPGEAERPVVAVNAAGHAVAVWELRAGADTSLYAAEYAPESGWGAPQRIEEDAAPVGLARAAVDGQGHALVVFQRRDGAQASVWAVRRGAGAGWGSPLLLEAKAAPVAPVLAAEAQGGALAAWVSVDAEGTRSVRASRFSPQGAWTAAEGVAALVDEAPLAAAVSLDGSASVVFRRSGADGTLSLRASRFEPGTGWGGEALLGGGATTRTETAVAMDRWGRVLAAWTAPGTSTPVLRLARFTRETGWQPVDVTTGHASQPAVAADGQGNFHAVWVENTSGEDRVWAARYPEGATALGLARMLEPAHGGTSKRPRVSASAGTGAATVWYRDNGEGFSSNLVHASAFE